MPGQYFDKETNTHYNYFRDYDPSIGRYIESDPIGLQGGINTYAYVRGSPLSRKDPKGLDDSSSQGWIDCYMNCMDKLSPPAVCVLVGANMSNYVTTITSIGYGSRGLFIGNAPRFAGLGGAIASAVTRIAGAIAVGWIAGTSVGCMASCAGDSDNYP